MVVVSRRVTCTKAMCPASNLAGIGDRGILQNVAGFLQPLHADLAGCLGQGNARGQVGHGDPGILAQHVDDLPVVAVQFVHDTDYLQ